MASSTAAALFTRLSDRLPPRFAHTWMLIAAASSCAQGQGKRWLPEIYRHAVKDMPLGAPARAIGPVNFKDDTPRRRVVRQLKETLLKSSILIGVGHPIEAGFALGGALDDADKDATFVREGFDTDAAAWSRGDSSIRRVYQHNIVAIDERMNETGLQDFLWISRAITYGQLLSPNLPEFPRAALTFAETEIVVLCCLIAAKAPRQVSWHLRGCLRAGMTAEEVEQCQQAIDICLEEMGRLADASPTMPRVVDVTETDDLK